MASGFYALFDDIATILDDVASMSKDVATITKVAGKKTSAILGDDLAVNAEKASGYASSRELPVLWAISKGSFINKLIILPLIFLLSAFFPWVITPLLLIGGTYLAYEGVEKIYEYFFHRPKKKKSTEEVKIKTEKELLAYEKKKVKAAILVDFILSIEIIIITLNTVVEEPLKTQIIVVSIIAILATIGVYSLVALIVRMDDFGYKLINRNKNKDKSISKSIGLFLVNALPYIIKILNVVGTIAMLLVAGGIYIHKIDFLHKTFHALPDLLSEFIIGLVIGTVCVTIVVLISKLFKKK